MTKANALQNVSECLGRIQRLESALALLQWDHRTGMPAGAREARADVIGELSRSIFQQVVSDEFGGCLETAIQEGVGPQHDRSLREIQRQRDRLRSIPADFYERLAVARSLSESAWEEARAGNDYAVFQPHLKTMIDLGRELASFFADGGDPYDALIEQYEPGMNTRSFGLLVEDIKEHLLPLVHELSERDEATTADPFSGVSCPHREQQAVLSALLRRCGVDSSRFTLGTTEHPFSLFIHPGDVRIAVRFDERDVRTGLFTCLHEGGHALYAQGIPAGMMWMGVDNEGVSHGIHESQSRFWENIMGRSLPFWEFFTPVLGASFPQFLDVSAFDLYRAVNPVGTGPVRINANELMYNFHIILRFEIERELFGGRLGVSELPARWREASLEYLGVEPCGDKDGLLQDIHWASGIFGGFPCYLLGNLYSAQLHAAMREVIPGMEEQIRSGCFEDVLSWLRRNVHERGKQVSPQRLLLEATGQELSAMPYVSYITEKYSAIYT